MTIWRGHISHYLAGPPDRSEMMTMVRMMVMMMMRMMVKMIAMRKRRGNQRQRSATTNGSLESQNCSYCGRLNTTSLSWCNGKYKYKDKWRQKIFFKQQCSALTSGDDSVMSVLLFVHFFQLFPCKKLLKLVTFQSKEEKQTMARFYEAL